VHSDNWSFSVSVSEFYNDMVEILNFETNIKLNTAITDLNVPLWER
jgi:hypothetical protein